MQKFLRHESLFDGNSLASNHSCMQAIHRGIFGTIEQMGWKTTGLMLDECNEINFCLEDEFRVDFYKAELPVSDEDVEGSDWW